MRKQADEQGEQLTRSDIEFMVQIAQERAELMFRLRDALTAGDTLLALELARQACGLPPETEH